MTLLSIKVGYSVDYLQSFNKRFYLFYWKEELESCCFVVVRRNSFLNYGDHRKLSNLKNVSCIIYICIFLKNLFTFGSRYCHKNRFQSTCNLY